jgi:DNA-binding HxlR family transcriptional regulator
MQKEVNKGKILGLLLKSPKTTAELARELGYINREGIARYNIINKDLKNLEDSGYVKSERIKLDQKPGNIPTLYSIIFDFPYSSSFRN